MQWYSGLGETFEGYLSRKRLDRAHKKSRQANAFVYLGT